MKYPIDTVNGFVNVIVLRNLDKDLEKLYTSLYDTYEKDKNQFSINTGKILGYIHPSALKNSNIHLYKGFINIVVRLPDNKKQTIHFFPQKLNNISDTTYTLYEKLLRNVYKLQLPHGFYIESADIYLGN